MAGNRRSGRRRTPTSTLVLKGSRIRHDKQDRRREPVVPPGIPPQPAYLAADPYAVDEWTRLVTLLEPLGVLTLADGPALELVATARADYRRLFEAWAADPQPVVEYSWVDSEGVTRSRRVENPLVRQNRQQKLLCESLLGAFGLTPVSRSKVTMHDSDARDEAEAFLQSRPTLVPFKKR